MSYGLCAHCYVRQMQVIIQDFCCVMKNAQTVLMFHIWSTREMGLIKYCVVFLKYYIWTKCAYSKNEYRTGENCRKERCGCKRELESICSSNVSVSGASQEIILIYYVLALGV